MKLDDSLKNNRSKENITIIVAWVGSDRERFSQLIKLVFCADVELSWRAAWAMSYCIQAHPNLAKTHTTKFLTYLSKNEINQGTVRSILRSLSYVSINQKHQTKILDICYRILRDHSETIANRAFSVSILARICKEHVALINEFKETLELVLEEEKSPAIVSRAKNELKQLIRIKKKILD